MIDLYVDGGVIGKNPSTHGGTWAWVQAINGEMVESGSGRCTPTDIDMPTVTNNTSELYAAIEGLANMPDNWNGRIFTDSETTRARITWERTRAKFVGAPDWLREELRKQMARLGRYKVVMLAGHPSESDLRRGMNYKGVPVSRHNVFCDELCGREALAFMANPDNFPVACK